MNALIVKDGYGQTYRLHLPGDRSIDPAIKPRTFHDLPSTQSFVRGLQVEDNQWIHILYGIDQKPRNVYNDNVYKIVAELIMRGRIKVYPITHLSQQGHAMGYPIIPADEGKQYRFIPASMLLINELRDVRIFRDHGTAEKFVQSLNLTDAHLEAIIQIHAKPTNDGSARSSVRMTTMLIELLAKGEVVVEKKIIAAAPPKPLEVESASGPGNRPATLGPHVGGLHNREYLTPNADPKQFKTVRQVDMGNLSVEDATVRKALKRQGRDDDKIEQILKSGDGFATKELKPGDKLYGFDSQNNKYGAKKQDSPYWLDETGYQDVKLKYYNNGQWDKEGIKNHLALPCMNRADVIDVAEVTKPQVVLESTVGKAREQIAYTNADYTTGMLGKIMPGGGKQITPDPTKTSVVTRMKGTP